MTLLSYASRGRGQGCCPSGLGTRGGVEEPSPVLAHWHLDLLPLWYGLPKLIARVYVGCAWGNRGLYSCYYQSLSPESNVVWRPAHS